MARWFLRGAMPPDDENARCVPQSERPKGWPVGICIYDIYFSSAAACPGAKSLVAAEIAESIKQIRQPTAPI